jgi:GNAT superfamily N-acetyltransferase
MIGIDRRHQDEGFGTALLEAITGLARAERERGRTDPTRSVSMRLDLLEALSDPEGEDRALLVAALE